MGRECEVSGKKTSFGNHKTERGKAKYLGGVGKKTTGLSRRTFKPNLQWIHVWLPNGKTRYVRVATSVIRSGQLTLEVDGKDADLPADQGLQGQRGSSEEAQEPVSDLNLRSASIRTLRGGSPRFVFDDRATFAVRLDQSGPAFLRS